MYSIQYGMGSTIAIITFTVWPDLTNTQLLPRAHEGKAIGLSIYPGIFQDLQLQASCEWHNTIKINERKRHKYALCRPL